MMARFILVVLVMIMLVAVAFVANHFLFDVPVKDEMGSLAAEGNAGPLLISAGGTSAAADRAATPTTPLIEEVVLGTAELTAGIPGEGPLTVAHVQAWLDDPKNHVELKPKLPLGLAANEMLIEGIDVDPLTRAKIELGRQLYFDPRLSSDHTISCASCHDPDEGYARHTQFGIGVGGRTGTRNSPVAFNRILSGQQFWDGRAASLEEQAMGPITNPVEMSISHEVCVATIADVPGYRTQFERIFPDGVTFENAAKAIAAFERAIVTGPAPWDYFVALRGFEQAYKDELADLDSLKEGNPDLYAEYIRLQQAAEAHPLSEGARRGGDLFFSQKADCTACHAGANFTDEQYHNLGVGMDAAEPDLGRFTVTQQDRDRGAFKTPTVRNVAQSAPYMHDGSQQTLEEVVEWYVKGGHANPHLDPKMLPLKLSAQDKADLVTFMKELTGELPKVERGRLPESAPSPSGRRSAVAERGPG
jgi:cytochrome c peroxidase